MHSLASVEDLGASVLSYGFTLYLQVSRLQRSPAMGVRPGVMQVHNWRDELLVGMVVPASDRRQSLI